MQARAAGSLKWPLAHSTPSTKTAARSSSRAIGVPSARVTAAAVSRAGASAVGGCQPTGASRAGGAIAGTSAVTVTARPPPHATPSPSQNWGSGGAVAPTASPRVTVAPLNFLLTGVTESPAVSVSSGPPSTRTVAIARPWTCTATPPSAMTPAQAHAGCPPQWRAARAALTTTSPPSRADAAASSSALSSGSGPGPRAAVTPTRPPNLAISPWPASGTQLVTFTPVSLGAGVREDNAGLVLLRVEDAELGDGRARSLAVERPLQCDLHRIAAARVVSHERSIRVDAAHPLVLDGAAVAIGGDRADDVRRAVASHRLFGGRDLDVSDLQRLVGSLPEVDAPACHDGGRDQGADHGAPAGTAWPPPDRGPFRHRVRPSGGCLRRRPDRRARL